MWFDVQNGIKLVEYNGLEGKSGIGVEPKRVFHAGIAHHKSQLSLLQQSDPQVVESGTDPCGTGVGRHLRPAKHSLHTLLIGETREKLCLAHLIYGGVFGGVRGWNLWVQKLKKGSRDGSEKRRLLIIAGRCRGWKTDLEALCKETIRMKTTCVLIWKGTQGRGWTWEL